MSWNEPARREEIIFVNFGLVFYSDQELIDPFESSTNVAFYMVKHIFLLTRE